MLPLLLFSSARAGVTFTPLNYRLSQDGLRQLIERLPTPLVIADADYRDVVADAGKQVIGSEEFIDAARRCRAGRGVCRSRRCRGGAVHLRHHVAAQSRRAHAQQSDQLHHRHRRVRRRGCARRRVDLCAAVSHRRGRGGAVESVRGPKDGVSAQLRRERMGSTGPRRRCDDGDGGADDAGPHRFGARTRICRSCRRCGTWPTAGRRSRFRWCARPLACCPTSAS